MAADSDYVAGLKARRLEIVTELSTLTRESGQPGAKPNALTTDGGTGVDHDKYKRGLYAELRDIDALLRTAAETERKLEDDYDVPFEQVTILE